jgi:GDP-L-fucose synthase
VTFWSDKRVLVTGGHGFLGTLTVEKLQGSRPAALTAPSRTECDLLDRASVRRLLVDFRPHIVLHLAAVVGGIGANKDHPGRFFYENALMGIQLIEEARLAGVGKLVCLGTICAYPKLTPVPFHEDDLWNGYPEETNAPYGLAKKMLLVQLQAYREEFGFKGVYLLPVNLYGPRDNFDLESSHVIPAMIRKFSEAADRGDRRVALWGDGSPTREFLYVDDAAEAILLAAERYDSAEPVNVGSGEEISIRDLAALIARETGFSGEVAWDRSRPNGQPRRQLDTSRAAAAFGWRARTPFDRGIRSTVAWFRANRPATKAPA